MNTLKIKLIIISILSSIIINAQIGIETNTVNGSGLLDFPEGTTKGIILPHVINVNNMNNISAGTLVFDGASAKVKYYNGVSWSDLTDKPGASPILMAGDEQNRSKGVIIGAPDSSANGVLILESSDKALILPKIIDPVTNVKSPNAGMMCYDPVAKLVCFYNGTDWFFWGKTTEI